jgi:hypothetical protein
MSSKYSRSNPSAKESIREYPNHNCNHLISTSLEDLNEKYQDLMPRQVDSDDVNKKNS